MRFSEYSTPVRAKAIAAVLALAAIAGLALPGVAGAQGPKGRTFKLHPEVSEAFFLSGTNGYVLSVTIRDRHTLKVSAAKLTKGLGTQSATYTVPYHQAPGSDEIEANLGRLGRIDVHFTPEETTKEPPILPQCTGGKSVNEVGSFVGLISFHGQRGFTRVHAHHAVGVVTTTPELTCRKEPLPEKGEKAREGKPKEGEGEEEAEAGMQAVGLKVKTAGGRVGFEAFVLRFWTKKKSAAIIGFEASASKHLGRIAEESSAGSIFAPGKSFLFPDPKHLTKEAVIRPGPPFKGAATFRRDAEGKPSWTGDLSVELPGYGRIPLAGKGTQAAICELSKCGK